MKKIVLFSAMSLILSCTDDSVFSPKKDCEIRNEGEVSITNISKNPYDIYVNSDWVKTVLGNSTATITVKAGFLVQFNAEQKSGYLLYPTKVSEKLNIDQCGITSWMIPM